MTGDSLSGVLADRHAGCRTAYLGSRSCREADLCASSLPCAVEFLP